MEGGHDLGLAEHVKADAVGEPGRRTFRIRIVSSAGSASIWMEKEQMQALSMAIDQLLAQLRSNRAGRNEAPAPPSESGDFPATATFDFQVGRLGLGYDDQRDTLVLIAHEREADVDGPPTLTCRVRRGTMRTLSSEIGTVVSAGRPRCPLCGTPLDGSPHVCPGSNGKTPHSLSGFGD